MEADADLNCREAARLLCLSCDRDLEPGEATALRHHLAECLMCATFEEQLEFLAKASRRYGRCD